MASLKDILRTIVRHALWREESEVVAIHEEIDNLPDYTPVEPGVKNESGDTPDFLKQTDDTTQE